VAGNIERLEKPLFKTSVPEAMPIMLQALEGLAFAHQQGFVHRALKPQNILLSGVEGQQVAKIADLGLAKIFISSSAMPRLPTMPPA
jgi:serine/threonine protein kinase